MMEHIHVRALPFFSSAFLKEAWAIGRRKAHSLAMSSLPVLQEKYERCSSLFSREILYDQTYKFATKVKDKYIAYNTSLTAFIFDHPLIRQNLVIALSVTAFVIYQVVTRLFQRRTDTLQKIHDEERRTLQETVSKLKAEVEQMKASIQKSTEIIAWMSLIMEMFSQKGENIISKGTEEEIFIRFQAFVIDLAKIHCSLRQARAAMKETDQLITEWSHNPTDDRNQLYAIFLSFRATRLVWDLEVGKLPTLRLDAFDNNKSCHIQ